MKVTSSDRSTVLEIQGCFRIYFDLSDLDKGGDETCEKRKAEEKKRVEDEEKRNKKWKKKM